MTAATTESGGQNGNINGPVKRQVTSFQLCAYCQANNSYQPKGSLMIRLRQVAKQVGLLRIGVLFKGTDFFFSAPLEISVDIRRVWSRLTRLTDVKQSQRFMFQASLHLI